MRILMVCYRYPPDLGGVEQAAAALSRALTGLGHEIVVIAGADIEQATRTREEGIDVYRFPLAHGRLKGARYVARARAIARALPRPDIVHAHIASGPAVAAVSIGGRTRAPVVVKPSCGAEPGGNLYAMMNRRGGRIRVALLRRRVDAFVAISERIASDLIHAWHVLPAKVIQIPNGVELERFHRDGARVSGSGGRQYLYVGRLWIRQKALDVLLEAWKHAGEPGTLTLVGDGPDRAALEAIAPPSVRFAGAVSDTASWYRDADVFVLPSRWEGMSNALLEAAAMGLPVIATAVGGAPEVLGSAGALVPPGDVGALAAALAAPPVEPVDAGTFAQRYGLEGVARRHVGLYESLLGGRTG